MTSIEYHISAQEKSIAWLHQSSYLKGLAWGQKSHTHFNLLRLENSGRLYKIFKSQGNFYFHSSFTEIYSIESYWQYSTNVSIIAGHCKATRHYPNFERTMKQFTDTYTYPCMKQLSIYAC